MLRCTSTTVVINDELLSAAKREAASEHISLREVIERALREHLPPPRARRYKLRWRTERGQLRPGVVFEDRDSLHDILDGRR